MLSNGLHHYSCMYHICYLIYDIYICQPNADWVVSRAIAKALLSIMFTIPLKCESF